MHLRGPILGYNVKNTHFRDIYGTFLFAEPVQEEHRLYRIGEKFVSRNTHFLVERVALVDDIQVVNISAIIEDVKITEPHF